MPRSNDAKTLDCRLDSCVCHLARCDDGFFGQARERSIRINADLMEMYWLFKGCKLTLPQFYASLVSYFGPSGRLYDDDKGSFAVPFKMTVKRGETQFRYLLKLNNYRARVDTDLYRVMRPGETYKPGEYREPISDELSKKDIQQLVGFIFGFLEGWFIGMPKWNTPFLKEIRSELILYGYSKRSGGFFEEEYESAKKYEADLARWRQEICTDPSSEELQDLPW